MKRVAVPFLGLALLPVLLWPIGARAELIAEVRTLLNRGQSDSAQKLIEQRRAEAGVTSELLEAMSWVARSALAHKDYETAQSYAEKTYELATPLLKGVKLDAEPHLPIAIGAATEVRAQALAARGENGKAVELLRRELQKYEKTSIALRLQKNLNLLTLEGKPAPELEAQHFLGPQPPRLSALRGKAVLLFFWADWCGDCKAEGPIIDKLRAEFADKGLTVLAPTQVYGDGEEMEEPPAAALRHIDEVRRKAYAPLLEVPAPVSAKNFRSYGASTVPTLVLVSPKGDVALYHPGRMSYAELQPAITAVLSKKP